MIEETITTYLLNIFDIQMIFRRIILQVFYFFRFCHFLLTFKIIAWRNDHYIFNNDFTGFLFFRQMTPVFYFFRFCHFLNSFKFFETYFDFASSVFQRYQTFLRFLSQKLSKKAKLKVCCLAEALVTIFLNIKVSRTK